MPMTAVHWLPRQAQHVRAFSSFRGARLLCREDGQKVMFTFITFFTCLDAVHGLLETVTNRPSWRKPTGRRWTAGTSGSRITS